jgi:hypothetical protein
MKTSKFKVGDRVTSTSAKMRPGLGIHCLWMGLMKSSTQEQRCDEFYAKSLTLNNHYKVAIMTLFI